jgi:hypothetical protein
MGHLRSFVRQQRTDSANDTALAALQLGSRSVIARRGVCGKQIGLLAQARSPVIVQMDADAIDAMPMYTRPFLVIRYPVLKGLRLPYVKAFVGTFAVSTNCAFGKDVDSSHGIERRVTGMNVEGVRVALSVESNRGHDSASFQRLIRAL